MLARLGYSCLLYLLLPFVFLHTLIQRLRAGHPLSEGWLSRFGVGFRPVDGPCILIHCVSVGEVTAAVPLIKQLMSGDPHLKVVVTTTTATGAAQVKNTLGDKVKHHYIPLDLPHAMASMLKTLQPEKVLIVEVELWPNMLHQCALRCIPVILVNGRMTARSANTYARLSSLFSPMMENLTHVAAQGQRDADNYLKLGLSEQKLTLTHNLKFDLPAIPDADMQTTVNPKHRPMILAGSTHDPEELALLEAFKQLKQSFPDALLVIVPRHPHRFDTAFSLCESQGWATARTSAGLVEDDKEVVLVDEMGKLSALYQLADVAFVGGSLANRGGHNALEAALYGVPVVMGPSQHNNPEICQQLSEAGALVTVHSALEIVSTFESWLNDTVQRNTAGQAGQAVIERNRGAIQATLAVINQC